MQNLMSLQDQVIIVTGAAQGIGQAVATAALAQGARVAVVDLKSEPIQALAAAHPDRVSAYVGSVSDLEFVSRSVQEVIERFGIIHGLVNNAGIGRPAMIEKMTLEQWQQVVDVHLTGSFLWLQAVGRTMLERKRAGDEAPASIVNVTSDAGRRGTIGQINYSAAKAGMLGLTMSAAREWAKHGIRTNSVSMGVVETPMTEVILGDRFRDGILAQIPMGRWSQPEEVAKSICFLLSDASSYIVGQHIGVNGGYHIAS
ncbi:3-oxoacyl-[acyl-carrier-protein] reductase [Pusillimonas sp. T7-7]|uniref:SDR family NAD(P)-dependent oxidoreductase n=1 Tax=Pusillimonas sp. (strain T7-7) TaxID=1007105 RepID=UPI0002084F5F|nr:SDR family NAD(P)-dependent oxidoreductase [Pusillimonas sp. T7-7]AEC21219.1 3-oxoacyl-[acyl-carrier-protein] reductase [Pusillimonas sp. T7-7]